MSAVTKDNFGPLVAYLVPGAVVLWGMSSFFPTLQGWFAVSPPNAPSLGGLLYLTVAALAVGMIVSALRWAVVDTLHAWTGIPAPMLDFSNLGKNVEAFSLLIEIHYKHYQFHSNMFVATGIAYACYRFRPGPQGLWDWADVCVLLLEALFFLTSRDNLRKYYVRGLRLLGSA